LSVSSAATSTASGLTGSLASQLDTAASILLANNWVSKPQLDHIKTRVINAKDPLPSAGRSLLAQFLLDNRLLPREQIADLDAIIRNQASLPGFQLLRKIGAGGMGTVFLATHLASKRQVALKTMNARLAEDKDFVERFHREARALEKVRNEHIAEIIACGDTEGTCWLAMEYIEGPSLMSLLKEHRVLPEHYALNLTRQVAEGLDHVWNTAHLIHRDIKPENVLVLRRRNGDDLFPISDTAKLIDFGLVKSNSDDDRLTQTGMTIGTPLYMSPEQVRGENLDCRSDIYGLGATLYHLLTGHTPYSGSSPGAIMSAHLTEPVPDPGDRVPSLSKLTRQLVMTAMAKSTEKRYTTFEALIGACNEALAGIDHKSGAIPRLLRKPMVLRQPVKRSGEFTADGQDLNATLPLPPPEAAEHDAPARPGNSGPGNGQGNRPENVPGNGPENGLGNGPAASPPPQPTNPDPRPESKPTKPITGTLIASRNAPTVVTATPKVVPEKTSTRPIPPPNPLPLVPKSLHIDIVVPPGRPPSSVATSSSDTQMPMLSSAFIEHPPSPGMGLLPWLALGFAILALTAFLAITYL
jgi:serine/threonine protein kinase